jgi:hypothetical protein
MMRKPVVQTAPTIQPDRAIGALTTRLDDLQKLKNRRFNEADADETTWEHLTQTIIQGAFGDPSTELSRFKMAGSNAVWKGMTSAERQRNVNSRIQEREAVLRALVEGLRLRLPTRKSKEPMSPARSTLFIAISVRSSKWPRKTF